MQKVVVAFDSETNSAKIKEIIESGGVASCLICRSAAEVKRVVHKQRLNIVICGFKLADESGQELYQDLPDSCCMLMIAPQSRLELCEEDGLSLIHIWSRAAMSFRELITTREKAPSSTGARRPAA